MPPINDRDKWPGIAHTSKTCFTPNSRKSTIYGCPELFSRALLISSDASIIERVRASTRHCWQYFKSAFYGECFCALVDVCVSIFSSRPNKEPLTPGTVAIRVNPFKGAQFNPLITQKAPFSALRFRHFPCVWPYARSYYCGHCVRPSADLYYWKSGFPRFSIGVLQGG